MYITSMIFLSFLVSFPNMSFLLKYCFFKLFLFTSNISFPFSVFFYFPELFFNEALYLNPHLSTRLDAPSFLTC